MLPSQLQDLVRDIPNFPKEGILFKDITPLLGNAKALQLAADELAKPFISNKIAYVAGIESRGFILGALLADRLDAGFIPIRKAGKLPHTTFQQSYALEYGEDVIEMHQDAFPKGANILLHDDVLATGGTAKAALDLLAQAEANVIAASFIMELSFLNGRSVLNIPVHTLFNY